LARAQPFGPILPPGGIAIQFTHLCSDEVHPRVGTFRSSARVKSSIASVQLQPVQRARG
jgi:hypothetical protein